MNKNILRTVTSDCSISSSISSENVSVLCKNWNILLLPTFVKTMISDIINRIIIPNRIIPNIPFLAV